MAWVRLEWGPPAIDVFEAWADIVVVVDVLSFSTAVDVAVSQECNGLAMRGGSGSC